MALLQGFVFALDGHSCNSMHAVKMVRSVAGSLLVYFSFITKGSRLVLNPWFLY
jgi:hypothetical protein